MPNFDVYINENLCTLCEDCLNTCNENVFVISDEMTMITQNEENCTGCKDCVDACLPGAISVSESLDAMKARHERERALRQRRIAEFDKAIERHGPNEDGEYKIPVKELLEVLEFKHQELLEDWLINQDDYIAFIDGDHVFVTQME